MIKEELKKMRCPSFLQVFKNSIVVSLFAGAVTLVVWAISYGMQELFVRLPL